VVFRLYGLTDEEIGIVKGREVDKRPNLRKNESYSKHL
jgi:hypothetical protein